MIASPCTDFFPANLPPPPFRRVGIWSPAGIPNPERLALGIERLERWGVEVIPPPDTDPTVRFFAGSDAARAEALYALLRTPQLDAIFAARGGYGAVRLLELFDWKLLRAANVPVIGYSDITALNLAFLANGLSGSVSGPMPAIHIGGKLATPEDQATFAYSMRSFVDAWNGNCSVELPAGVNLNVLRPGRVEAPVVPANLMVMLAQLGTPWMPDLTGSLLILEDVDEAAYQIDRGLTQLRQVGILSKLAGLVFADFRNVEDREWLPEILAEFAQHISGPVATGLPYGHCWPMTSVPVGRQARLECGDDGNASLFWI